MAVDLIFKALADPTRRALLDALFETDGQSLGALSARCTELTRFAVMKHLRVLAEANLIATQRQGRSTLHYLNPVPIAQLAERWISKYAAPYASALVDLDRHTNHSRSGGPMSRPAHVYQIFIAAPPEQVWQALLDPEWTRRYFHRTAFTEPPAAGQPFQTVLPDGRPAIDGVVDEVTPPAGDRPGRFVHSWHILYDDDLAAETPGRVEWEVAGAGDGLTRVRLVHSGLEASPLTSESVRDGWVWILDGLKTVLETGRSLPPVDDDLLAVAR